MTTFRSSWLAIVLASAGLLGLSAFAGMHFAAEPILDWRILLSVSALLLAAGSLVAMHRGAVDRAVMRRHRGWQEDLAESMGEAAWIYDPALREIVYANPVLEEIWGVGVESVRGDMDRISRQPLDGAGATFQALFDAQLVGAPPGCFDYTMRRPDGTPIWVRMHYVRVHDPSSRRDFIVGKSSDVTELKTAEEAKRQAWQTLEARVLERTSDLTRLNEALAQEAERRARAERELRASSSRLRALLDHTFDLFFEIDESGRFLDANPRLLKAFGYRRDELLGLPFEAVFEAGSGDPSPSYVFARHDTADPRVEGGLHQARTRDGSLIHLEWCAVRSKGESGKRLVAFGRDVTDRVVAERRFSDLFQSGPDAQVAIDGRGRIVLFNVAAERLFGWSASDVVGRNVEVLIPGRYRSAHSAALMRFMQSPGSRRIGGTDQLWALRSDGSEVPVEINLAALSPNEEIFVVAAIRDIGDRLREVMRRELLEARLRQSQRLDSLGVLAGGVAHDFNNLLGAVLNYANLALLRSGDALALREDISQIKAAVSRMSDLAGQMLTYAGRGASDMELVDLSEEITEIRTLLASSISKNAVLEEILPANLPKVKVDPAQLRQIVMNLIINASEALGDEPGRIRLRAGLLEEYDLPIGGVQLLGELPGEGVYLEISDTGCGMAAEVVDRMFEPFFSTKETGRGLGLAAVVGIVRRHGGTIVVESDEGSGTRVLVAFPASRETVRSKVAKPDSSISLEASRILVVDDEDPVRESARSLLEARGATVVACADGGSALRELRARPFDAVLLDLTMPGMGGRAVLAHIRKTRPDLPVVLCSGYQFADDDAIELERDPRLALVQKPYDLNEVIELVRGLMRRAVRG